jgi:uncharacterized protein (DUF2147 family)
MKMILTIAVVFTCMFLQAQNSFVGKWKAIDDLTGNPLAVIDLFEKNDKIYGKVVEIVNPKNRNINCEKCEGEDRMQPVLGMVVIKGLVKDGNEYNGGKILDPKTGKLYKCYVSLENDNKLKVRGYIGFSLFGRTQYWHRVKE